MSQTIKSAGGNVSQVRYGAEFGAVLKGYFDNPPYIPAGYKMGFVWTAKHFAHEVGVSDAAVRQWLRGNALPTNFIVSIIDVLFGPKPQIFESDVKELWRILRQCQESRSNLNNNRVAHDNEVDAAAAGIAGSSEKKFSKLDFDPKLIRSVDEIGLPLQAGPYPDEGLFPVLLDWHLRIWGTRPSGNPKSKGKAWSVIEFSQTVYEHSVSIEASARNVYSWLRAETTPPNRLFKRVETSLFGENDAYYGWQMDLRRAYYAIVQPDD